MMEIEEPEHSYKEYPGPILLLAGPGTGKTWQLAHRVKYLLEERGAAPSEMTVITFTNEAARNMRDRLDEQDVAIPAQAMPEYICTMHSLGNSIIGENTSLFGLPADYSVLDEKGQREVLLKDAASIAGFDRSAWKLADALRSKGSCAPDLLKDARRIESNYIRLLRKCGRVDYEDQLFLAIEALKTESATLSRWRERTRYLLVDEYQDINAAQCEFIRLLAQGNPDGLFAVGDDDQSIYSFRGGDPRFIKDFEAHLGVECKIGRLSRSWRCPENILVGARGVISAFYSDSVPKPPPCFEEKMKGKSRIVFFDTPSFTREAGIIAGIAKDKVALGSVTILIPHGKYLPPIKEGLQAKGIEFTYKDNIDFTGIASIAMLADWVDDPGDSLVLRDLVERIILNHDELTKLVDWVEGKVTAKRNAASVLLSRLWAEVSEHKSLYDILRQQAQERAARPFIVELYTCLEQAKRALLEKGGSRAALPEFLRMAGVLVAPGKNPNGLVSAIREWVAEKRASKKAKSARPVRIYNLPSSKGLQADVVMVTGLSEGLFPEDGDDLAEKSRLLYVAMTRAKEELYLFSARTRPASITFKDNSYQLSPSRFISAIPKERIEVRRIYPSKRRTS